MKILSDKILKLLQIISCLLFVLSITCIIYSRLQYKAAKNEYTNLEEKVIEYNEIDLKNEMNSNSVGKTNQKSQNAVSNDLPATEDTTEHNTLDAFEVIIDFDYLKSVNDEIIAYIVIPDTNISYPVTQTDNNDYYLNHTFSKYMNGSGCIFIDKNCANPFFDFQTVIYGHHMKDQSMFGGLEKYKNFDYAKQHPNIYVYTEDATYCYEIFSVYPLDASEIMVYNNRNSQIEQKQYFNELLDKSIVHLVKKNIEMKPIISLMTCDYSGKDYRLFVHGRLIDKSISNK